MEPTVSYDMNDPTLPLSSDDILATMDPEISADPNRYPVLNVDGTLGSAILNTFKASMTEAHSFYGQLEEVEKQMHAASPNWSVVGKNNSTSYFRVQNGREHEFQDILDKAFTRVTQSMDAKMDAILGFKGKLESKIAEAIKDPSDGGSIMSEMRAREVRDYARSLDPMARNSLVSQLIRAGDKRSVAAIIHAPAFLSGFSDEENAEHKQFAEAAFAAEAYEQLQQTKEVIKRLNHAFLQVRERYGKSKRSESSPGAKLSKALADLRGAP